MTRSIQQLFDLKGQTALITGGSRGLGLQMAHALGEAGARIMVTSRKASDLEQAVQELQAAGTCLRDYVHVSDLVDAHVLGLGWLLDGKGNAEFNLGSGRGFSVREVIAASTAVTNRTVPVVEGPRRAGDAAALVSGSTRAVEVLGWKPRYPDLADMIRHAYEWGQTPGFSK